MVSIGQQFYKIKNKQHYCRRKNILMKKILLQLVKVIKNERYVIIKLKENFPNNFNKGSDLDILCEDKINLFLNSEL